MSQQFLCSSSASNLEQHHTKLRSNILHPIFLQSFPFWLINLFINQMRAMRAEATTPVRCVLWSRSDHARKRSRPKRPCPQVHFMVKKVRLGIKKVHFMVKKRPRPLGAFCGQEATMPVGAFYGQELIKRRSFFINEYGNHCRAENLELSINDKLEVLKTRIYFCEREPL